MEIEERAVEHLTGLSVHDHVCLIHGAAEEWPGEMVLHFLDQGLKRGEKCLYVLEAHRGDEVGERLRRAGMDVTALIASGQLAFHESESYTRSLSFDPNRVIALLVTEAQKAMDQGYRALRVTDEMSWALPGRPGSEKVLEYEAKLNRDFFPRYPCIALCQYHQAKFDVDVIKGAIMTHPLVARGDHIYGNSYYIPPEAFLGERRAEHEVERLLQTFEEVRENRQRAGGMQEAVHEIARFVEARDPYSAGHQERVATLARRIAEEMKLPQEQVDEIWQAGLVHDIGKMYVSATLLTKPGQLTEDEFATIKGHPAAGSDLLKRMRFPYPIPEIVLQHHEKMDGSGYPRGLGAEDTVLSARILAVADVVEAMSLGRSYRDALGIAKALQDISWNKGSLYDAQVVDACLSVFTEKGFRFK